MAQQSAARPPVAVVVLCRDEARHIARCLDTILGNDYPPGQMEVLVVDGLSSDGTREIVDRYARADSRVHLLSNEKRSIPAGMNLAAQQTRAEIILKMDAHSEFPSTYISRCVRYLLESGADNVGGVCRMLPGNDSLVARVIAAVLAHPFGSGNSPVKVGAGGARWTDTVAFGCYRREVFARVGPWDERLAGSSDLDFNARLRAAGGRILLKPDVVIAYRADPDLRTFVRHNFADGVWATYVLRYGSRGWAWRHRIPLGLVLVLAGLGTLSPFVPLASRLILLAAVSYAVLNFASSLHVALQRRLPAMGLVAPVVFTARHLSYGLGSLFGLWLLLLPSSRWAGRRGRRA